MRARVLLTPMDAPTLAARPRVVRSTTYLAPTLLGTAYITVSNDDAGAPLEAFVNIGKAGSDTFAVAEAMGRLVSLILRMPSSLSQRERAGQIVAQLSHIGGVLGEANNLATRALPDALASALAEHLHLADAQAPTAENSGQALEARAPVTVPSAPSNLAASRAAPKAETRVEKPEFLNLSRANGSKGASPVKELQTEVKQAAQALGDALKDTPTLRAYAQASARLEADADASGLLDELGRVQADLRIRQSNGGISQTDIAHLRRLQSDVQSNPTIAAYVEAQQMATFYLPEVNQAISEMLGVDFASLGRVNTC